MEALKQWIKSRPLLFRLAEIARDPWGRLTGWLWAAWLTFRFVDECDAFPAFQFKGRVPIRIKKGRGARIVFKKPILLTSWMGGDLPILIDIGPRATLRVNGYFPIGEDTRIHVDDDAEFLIEGAPTPEGPGITFRSVILVKERIVLGRQSGIAWETFVTDSDWHPIGGRTAIAPVLIGDRVWVTPGCKILKGAEIGSDCIVANNSVVTMARFPDRSLIGGAPAKVLRSEIPAWTL